MLRWIRKVLARRSLEGTGPKSSRENDQAEAWVREALAASRDGDASRAEQLCRQILEERPDDAQALCLLGEIEALRQNHAHAASLIRRAIAIDDSEPRFHFALGCALQADGEPLAAAECYRRALALAPTHVSARINLGCILQAQSEFELSASGARRLAAGRGLDEALLHFRAATEMAPAHPDGWINLGYAMERQRNLAAAIECYDRALAIDPGLAHARFNRSMALLAQGRLLEGWDDYEWRWQASGFPKPAFSQPEWDGSPLQGKRIILYTEQGFGDAIQFVRFVRCVADLGGHVIVRCAPELQRLLAGVPGVREVLKPRQPLPQFDVHCPLLSLPRVLGVTTDMLPVSTSYVRPEDSLVAEWFARISDGQPGLGDGQPGPKVGLAWMSHSLNPDAPLKSTTLQAMAPLGGAAVRFFSLQTGDAGADAASAPMRIADLGRDLRDFADTAALIANLDLTISIDTAVAHLAGAMGKPVWIVLPFVPDWRWQPDARASKWYPSMRLYRQSGRGDWDSVFREVAADLRQFAIEPRALLSRHAQQ